MNAPITNINCLGINFEIAHTHTRTHLLYKRIVSELLCDHVGPHSKLKDVFFTSKSELIGSGLIPTD